MKGYRVPLRRHGLFVESHADSINGRKMADDDFRGRPERASGVNKNPKRRKRGRIPPGTPIRERTLSSYPLIAWVYETLHQDDNGRVPVDPWGGVSVTAERWKLPANHANSRPQREKRRFPHRAVRPPYGSFLLR